MIFKNTYIYIKTCEHCGLKYFGKSTRNKEIVKNKYKGSGKLWKRHIKKYNSNIKTFIINSFDKNQEQECIDFCLWFSRINNIVKNDEWANLCNENGIDGGNKFIHKSEEEIQKVKDKISKTQLLKNLKGKNSPNYGKIHTNETKIKISNTKKSQKLKLSESHRLAIINANTGRKRSEKTKQKISQSNKGRMPWIKGKTHYKETKQKISEIQKTNLKYCAFCNKKYNGGNYVQHNHHNGFCLFR